MSTPCPISTRVAGDGMRAAYSSRSKLAWLAPLLTTLVAVYVAWLYKVDSAQTAGWGCEMSWMTPSYLLMETPESPVPRYRLYLYRESGWDVQEEPSGHPVIFIPGNAGSYQQVRSIASSASRQFYGQDGKMLADVPGVRSMDFYTLDVNEDFTAFHGQTIRDQALFLDYCIKKVLDTYSHLSKTERPTQVTLLGHSMGGIVARLAALEHGHTIDAIVTMSTPHLLPPVAIDAEVARIYSVLGKLKTVPILLSICGGSADSQIASDGCALSSDQITPEDGFAVFASGIPGAWTGVDHQAMVWCHQVRWRVARALLEMSKHDSRSAKLQAARDWLSPTPYRSEDLSLAMADDLKTHTFGVHSNVISIILRKALADSTDRHPSVSLEYCPDGDACRPHGFTIQSFPSPADQAAPFPLPGEGIKTDDIAFALILDELQGGGELRLKAPRRAEVELGYRTTTWIDQVTRKTSIVPSVEFGYLLVKSFAMQSSSLLVYRLSVELQECDGPVPVIKYTSAPSANLQDRTEESRYFLANDPNILLHSHIGSTPFINPAVLTASIELEVFQSPQCRVKSISAPEIDYWRSLVKALLRYRTSFVAWTVGWSAIVLYFQISAIIAGGDLPAPLTAVATMGLRGFAAINLSGGVVGAAQRVWTRASPDTTVFSQILLGQTDMVALVIGFILSTWCLGLVISVAALFPSTRRVLSRTERVGSPSPGEKEQMQDMRSSHNLVHSIAAFALFCIAQWLLPNRIVFIILYVLAVGISFATNLKPFDVNLLDSVLTLMTFLLPFQLPIAAVWIRNLLNDWHQMPKMDRGLLQTLPLFLSLAFVVERRGTEHLVRSVIPAIRMGTALLAFVSFVYGSRYTWLIPLFAVFIPFSLIQIHALARWGMRNWKAGT